MSDVVDFPVRPEARPYLDAFERRAAADEPAWLAHARRRHLARFAELGFPSRRSEEWRYLDLRRLADHPLLPVAREVEVRASTTLEEQGIDGAAYRLVFVDGGFSAAASARIGLPAGVWFGPISAALAERPELVREALERDEGEAVAALNAGLFSDGYVLDVAPGVAIDRPIEIVHLVSAGAAGSLHTRSLVTLAPGSRAAIVETYLGTGADRYWRNDVLDARLAEGAALERTVVVEEAAAAVHLAVVRARLSERAEFGAFVLVTGGGIVRQEMRVELAGEGARCRLDGAFVVDRGDEANIVTIVDHRAPGGKTRELVKGVAAGRGHGAFQGRITVREGAQRTDAQQVSRNLIIGRRAVIDSKPELEILADDVKCAHGASVGDLDEAALFYLRARGIGEAEARRLLVEGFLREAVERVADPALRERLLRRLARRLAALEA